MKSGVDYPALKLPLEQLFVSLNDGRIEIETEDGKVLLSFESFDEYSGIECKEGALIDIWEKVEADEVKARIERRQAREQSQ
jgi:hypothetical protein